jgi:ABC-type multidrug transport system fused ATPase/permease subunit
MSFIVVNSLFIISVARNIFICVLFVVFFIVSVFYRNLYMAAMRDCVRLQKITKSPISGCINEAINGVVELRALKKQKFTLESLAKLVDENSKNNLMVFSLKGWFRTRVVMATLILILIPNYSYILYKIYSADVPI